ncbi:hypothetical protein SteCoe_9934 [Stentor coeruleus]|uniref:LNR domain-containing protein n=1 Tax=Stentor coeruleus TaxID=5963 RepID=A0A1R2CGW9_9CILI|nr:hypothetical protein SteCoe_9934 [Stentor coeruleus]
MNYLLVELLLYHLAQMSDASCPEKCNFEENLCDKECTQHSCVENSIKCYQIRGCSEKCLEKLHNFQCDPECDIPECFWDGYSCKTNCPKSCDLLSDWGNSHCDLSCNNENCGWDGGDCKKRQLSICSDCSGVTIENPFEIKVGNTESFQSLSQALFEGLCCEYNTILIKQDTNLDSAYGSKIIIDSKSVKKLTIKGDNFIPIIKVSESLTISIEGSNLYFDQITFNFQTSFVENNFFFAIDNKGTLNLTNTSFQKILSNIFKLSEGSLNLESCSFSGKFIGMYLIHTYDCGNFCSLYGNNLLFENDNSITNKNFENSLQILLYAKNTEISLNSILFKNIINPYSFAILNECKIYISNIVVENVIISEMFYIMNSDNLIIKNVRIYYSNFGIGFFKSKFCLNGEISEVISKHVETSKGIFIFQGTEIRAINIQIYEVTGTTILCEKESILIIKNSTIINQNSTESSGINIVDSDVEVTDIVISGMKSKISGCMSIIRNYNENYNTIENSKFLNCETKSGAGLYIEDADTNIFGCEFSNNIANNRGGGLKLKGVLNWPTIIVENSTFYNNTASGGGGLHWTKIYLVESENDYINNSALFGIDKATSIESLEYANKINNVIPGKVIPQCLIFILKDYYNQTISDDNSSVITLSNGDKDATSSIYGNDLKRAINGQFKFCNFIVYGAPGSKAEIKAELFTSRSGLLALLSVTVELLLSECKLGEVVTNNKNECIACEEGFYSFFNNETSCHKCPADATCSGNELIPVKGFWHSSPSSTSIFPCINADACSSNGTCFESYTGNLCAVCEKGYVYSSSNTCKKCPSKTENIVLITFLSVLFTIIICYIIYRTYEDANEMKVYHSVLIKILMNYFQVMMITSALKMRWPKPFYQLINIQEQIGSSTGKLLSIDCLIQDTTDISPFYVNILLNFLAPFILGSLIALVWGIVALFKGIKRIIIPFTTSIVVVLFLIHPGISNMSLSIFYCFEINEGEFWNLNALDIQCYTNDYARDYYAIFILGLILWTIGMPAIAYAILRKNKKELETTEIKAKYGFLYHGYHSNRYYWEFVIMFRKILIISVALFLKYCTVPLQLIFILFILIGALVLNLYYKPFELNELNRTENFSIGLSIICFTSGLMIEFQDSYVWHAILFTILIIFNFLFFCYFAKRVYQAIGHYLWNACPHIARALCPKIPRPRIKIREIIQKESRKKNNGNTEYELQPSFADSNREVVIQLCNMRSYVDLYNEILAARFSSENIDEIERRENIIASQETNLINEAFDITPQLEPRPFYKRLFSRKKNKQAIKDKIDFIRKNTHLEVLRQSVSELDNEECENLQK